MSKIRLYSNSLFFEVYLIGYNSQGESILFFLRTDEGVIYSGVVDCYTYKSINKTIDLLKKENIEKIDFLCWTHPHDDHSLGITLQCLFKKSLSKNKRNHKKKKIKHKICKR